jgi:hypothetical protein
MHARHAQRQAGRDARIALSRDTARSQQRQYNGRFAPPALPSPSLSHLDRRPGQPPRPHAEAGVPHPEPSEGWNTTDPVSATETRVLPPSVGTSDIGPQTIDYGTYPVGAATSVATWETTSLDLPPIEDTESIQLALMEVVHALAANTIDAKRAGLLLYALQVASANAKHLNIPASVVRAITYTKDGIALAPQDYGWDVEDVEEEIRREDEENEEDQDK